MRRAAGVAVVALVLVVAGGVAASTLGADDAETVRTGATAAACHPRSPTASENAYTVLAQQPPKTADAMVRGGGDQHLIAPEVVARVKVLEVEEVPWPNELLLLPAPPAEVRARVEVTEGVLGAEAGDRLTISDAGTAAQHAALASARYPLQARIDEVQQEIDALNRPLELLDEQIVATPPTDPSYDDLLRQREVLKERTDADRSAAQAELMDDRQRLEVVQLMERTGTGLPTGTPCHRFAEGDDLIVSLVRPADTGPYELIDPSAFFLVEGSRLSPELDAARDSVPGWSDSELLRLARESTPDELLDHLRDAAHD